MRLGHRAPLVVVVAVVAFGAIVLLAGPLGSGSSGNPALTPTIIQASIPPGASSRPGPNSPLPTSSQPSAIGTIPIVPVTNFRSPWASTDAAEVAAVLAGKSSRYRAVEVLASDADAVLAAIGTTRPATGSRLITVSSATAIRDDLARTGDRLGFLPASDVVPSVRALAWGGVSLFGVDRVATLGAWPLGIAAAARSASAPYDPAAAWTLVAGGDINLDGSVAYHVKTLGLGVDFPFAGGTAEILSRHCCSTRGGLLPRARRTGNAGAVHDQFSKADLSIANFENPAPNDFIYHPGGYRFSADPALIEGLKNAGIDWVSLANNHIGDSGARGIADTIANLDRWGIAHGGSGPTLAAARAPSILQAGGIKVAILGYDTIKPAYGAGAATAGSNQMSASRVREDVAAARALGANLVVVFPHWGVEYTANPTVYQRALAHAAIDAGADIVIGNHPHWAGAVEVYKGKPTFYALGDFVFNIDRSEQTEEGITLELTYSGTRLVQAQIHPYLILDGSQPNFLDPAGSGKIVLDQVFRASGRLLPW